MTSRWIASSAMVAALAGLAWLNVNWTETPLDLSPVMLPNALALNPNDIASSGSASEQPAALGDALSESLARPLFHASRRPFVAPPPVQETLPPTEEPMVAAVEQPGPPPALPELRLAGVSASGERKRALIGEAGAPELRWLNLGESIAGWRVDTITASAVVLMSGDQRFTVALYPAYKSEGGAQ